MNSLVRFGPANNAPEDDRDRQFTRSTDLVVRTTEATISAVALYRPGIADARHELVRPPFDDIGLHEISVGIKNESLVMLRELNGSISMKLMVIRGDASDPHRNPAGWRRISGARAGKSIH